MLQLQKGRGLFLGQLRRSGLSGIRPVVPMMRLGKRCFSLSAHGVKPENRRNLAIVAHVDHGKTTLVDTLLQQSQTVSGQNEERAMDSNQLEKERGITILSKCTSILWDNPKDGERYELNIVDTPGHADFGGEVERIMNMVDGVALVVDASEGPMTQTKFVLSKALARGVKPFVVFNKVDRQAQRVGEVETEVFDLFDHLGADDDQLDFPMVYATAKDGWSTECPDEALERSAKREAGEEKSEDWDMTPVLQMIVDTIKPPPADFDAPFRMIVTQLDKDDFVGKLLLGRVTAGTVNVGDKMNALSPDGTTKEKVTVTKIFNRRGLEQVPVDSARAGDIVSIAGFADATVNDTLCDESVTEPIEHVPIDPPTMSMTFGVNTSPLAGREGTMVTATQVANRLTKEAETNVSLKIEQNKGSEAVEVSGRGELQLGVLIETMRREGYEITISPPKVVFQTIDGKQHEPVEEVVLDVESEYSGAMIEKMAHRKGELQDFSQTDDGRSRLVFHIPTRGFLGFQSEFINETKGTGVINHTFLEYVPHRGVVDRAKKGALISNAAGKATGYAIDGLQQRGMLFVDPGEEVYGGMVVGERSTNGDLEINPVKAKAVNNMRASGKDEKMKIIPAKKMNLEETIAYMRDDECMEVTPTAIRLRKQILDQTERKIANRADEQRRKAANQAKKGK